MEKIHFFIRLLTYDEAVKVCDKMIELGGYGNITVGGISVEGSKAQWQDLITFLGELDARYELCKDHPTKVSERIVNKLKEDGLI